MMDDLFGLPDTQQPEEPPVWAMVCIMLTMIGAVIWGLYR
jgi:hypothetical protein